MVNVREVAEEIALIAPRISRRIISDLFQIIDIPHAQLVVVMMLFYQGPCRASNIGRELKVAAPTATGIINRLEKSGYVKRTPDKADRRTVNVELTVKGKKVAQQLKTAVVNRWSEILEKIPSKDVCDYLRILRKIKEVV